MRFQLCVWIPLLFILSACAQFSQKKNSKNYYEKLAKKRRIANMRQVSQEVSRILNPVNSNKQKLSKKKLQISEEDIFVGAVKAYQAKSRLELESSVRKLLKNHPRGLLVDNALYLLGDLYMKNKKYAQASKVFTKVIDSYPAASHRSVSLYKKAQAYERLNLLDLAENTFKLILKEYPGSPESFLVKDELNLISAKRKSM